MDGHGLTSWLSVKALFMKKEWHFVLYFVQGNFSFLSQEFSVYHLNPIRNEKIEKIYGLRGKKRWGKIRACVFQLPSSPCVSFIYAEEMALFFLQLSNHTQAISKETIKIGPGDYAWPHGLCFHPRGSGLFRPLNITIDRSLKQYR